jgi:hypothetical protein
VTPVCEVVVEDCFDGFWRLRVDAFRADVDPLVGELGDEFDALFTKGRSTGPM